LPKTAEVEALSDAAKPTPTFATSDQEVVYRLQEAYAARYLRPIKVFRPQPGQFLVEDPETLGPSIAENVASERAKYGDEADVRLDPEREESYGSACVGTNVTFTELLLHGARVSVTVSTISGEGGIVAGAV